MTLIIILVSVQTIFNLALYALMFWSGVNPIAAGITSKQAVITMCIAVTAIVFQIGLSLNHINSL